MTEYEEHTLSRFRAAIRRVHDSIIDDLGGAQYYPSSREHVENSGFVEGPQDDGTDLGVNSRKR